MAMGSGQVLVLVAEVVNGRDAGNIVLATGGATCILPEAAIVRAMLAGQQALDDAMEAGRGEGDAIGYERGLAEAADASAARAAEIPPQA